MSAGTEDVGQPERDVSPWRATGILLLLTVCLSGVFWVLI